jgi:hypothetical protein
MFGDGGLGHKRLGGDAALDDMGWRRRLEHAVAIPASASRSGSTSPPGPDHHIADDNFEHVAPHRFKARKVDWPVRRSNQWRNHP